MLWECFAAGGPGALQNRWYQWKENYVDVLKQHQDISQEVKAWLKMGLPNEE